MRSFQKWILIFSVLCIPALNVHGEGLPVPWPFPWAKECPIDWKSLNGVYSMSDATDASRIDMEVSSIGGGGLKVMHLSLFASDGTLQLAGLTIFGVDARMIRIYLTPASASGTPVLAVVKMHYAASAAQCAPTASALVPILTLESSDPSHFNESQYKLQKCDKVP